MHLKSIIRIERHFGDQIIPSLVELSRSQQEHLFVTDFTCERKFVINYTVDSESLLFWKSKEDNTKICILIIFKMFNIFY